MRVVFYLGAGWPQWNNNKTNNEVNNNKSFLIVEVHLAIKLAHRHSTFNNLKETT